MSTSCEDENLVEISDQVQVETISLPLPQQENILSKLSDTFITGSLITGTCYAIVNQWGKAGAFNEYFPYFLASACSLPLIKYFNHYIINPGANYIAKQIWEESTAIKITKVITDLVTTAAGSTLIISASKMLEVELGDHKENALQDVLSKSIACGAIPKFCIKLANGSLDYMSYETLISFSNQFIRKGVKTLLDNTKDYKILPHSAENKLLGAIAGSVMKNVMLKKSNMDIFESVGLNVLNTFVYDVTDMNSLIRKGLGQLEEVAGLNKTDFTNTIIATTITEASEPYIDSLALCGVQELFNLYQI